MSLMIMYQKRQIEDLKTKYNAVLSIFVSFMINLLKILNNLMRRKYYSVHRKYEYIYRIFTRGICPECPAVSTPLAKTQTRVWVISKTMSPIIWSYCKNTILKMVSPLFFEWFIWKINETSIFIDLLILQVSLSSFFVLFVALSYCTVFTVFLKVLH